MSGDSLPYDGTGLRKDRPRNEAPAKQEAPKQQQQADTFTVSDHNIDEVKDFIGANPDQIDAVLKAEKAGDNRKTLVEWLDTQKDDSGLL